MTKRVKKSQDGKYRVKGKTYTKLVGSRASVWHKNAYKTTGGLTRSNLLMNKLGRIVSLKKHKFEKSIDRLAKYGIKAKRGVFGPGNKKKTEKRKKIKRRQRGKTNKKR
tara:strand:- start:207 stop:533 length:327 start_codon:yes stop_codon:yes gene_type:complete